MDGQPNLERETPGGERYSRQASLVPYERLQELGPVTVAGLGAVGKQAAMQLTCLGVPELTLVDFDTVQEGNLSPQAFRECDLGRTKVEVVAELCQQLDSRCKIRTIDGRLTRGMVKGKVLFCCVDKIENRSFIWNAVKDRVEYFGDSRVSVEVIRLLTVFDKASREHYPQTLFSQEQAFNGPCTAKMTIYMANLAAGFLVAQFTKWLRDVPMDPDLAIDVFGMNMAPIK